MPLKEEKSSPAEEKALLKEEPIAKSSADVVTHSVAASSTLSGSPSSIGLQFPDRNEIPSAQSISHHEPQSRPSSSDGRVLKSTHPSVLTFLRQLGRDEWRGTSDALNQLRVDLKDMTELQAEGLLDFLILQGLLVAEQPKRGELPTLKRCRSPERTQLGKHLLDSMFPVLYLAQLTVDLHLRPNERDNQTPLQLILARQCGPDPDPL